MKNKNWDIIGGNKSLEEAFDGGCTLSLSTFPGHHDSSLLYTPPHNLLASPWAQQLCALEP